MKNLSVEAKLDKLDEVTDFVYDRLVEAGFSLKKILHIRLCVEEIFSNISRYAYPKGRGFVEITVERLYDPERVCIVFSDNGLPFDPLSKADPDTASSFESDELGGFGIFMVKKEMDGISYRFENGCNILTIEKLL